MQNYITPKNLVYTIYALVLGAVTAAWLQSRSWSFTGFRPYQFLSLLGLTAFVTMLVHYVAGFVYHLYGKDRDELASYYRITGIIVFACILLHPVLIILNLKALGFGLPPASYKAYYGQALLPYIFLGMAAWLAFIAYEFKQKVSQKSWWKYVLIANDAAMLAIVVHGFHLGTVIRLSWFRKLWGIFFAVLIICLVQKYAYAYSQKKVGK